jgi:hypothetical protein
MATRQEYNVPFDLTVVLLLAVRTLGGSPPAAPELSPHACRLRAHET